jgi:hypothetical protein
MSCKLLPNHVKLKGSHYYQHDKGCVIYAIIEAPTEADALAKAAEIVQQVTERTFGQGSIT